LRALSANILFLQFVVIIALVLIDVVVSVAKAIGTGKFEWSRLLCFLRVNVVPFVLVWGVLAAVGWAAQKLAITDATLISIVVFVDIIYGLIVLRLGASILSTFKDMGIPTTPTVETKAPATTTNQKN
jgi:hypothetical protein